MKNLLFVVLALNAFATAQIPSGFESASGKILIQMMVASKAEEVECTRERLFSLALLPMDEYSCFNTNGDKAFEKHVSRFLRNSVDVLNFEPFQNMLPPGVVPQERLGGAGFVGYYSALILVYDGKGVVAGRQPQRPK
jgi:hypothetical protein